jgi:hypothetical protein
MHLPNPEHRTRRLQSDGFCGSDLSDSGGLQLGLDEVRHLLVLRYKSIHLENVRHDCPAKGQGVKVST